jgi:hypothetical protein
MRVKQSIVVIFILCLATAGFILAQQTQTQPNPRRLPLGGPRDRATFATNPEAADAAVAKRPTFEVLNSPSVAIAAANTELKAAAGKQYVDPPDIIFWTNGTQLGIDILYVPKAAGALSLYTISRALSVSDFTKGRHQIDGVVFINGETVRLMAK